VDLAVKELEGVNVVDVNGRIDSIEAATELGNALNNSISQGKAKIVINLGEVDYMNSAALGSLISARKAAKEKGGELKLANLQSFVMEVFKKSQLVQVFNIIDTVDNAVKSF